MKSVFHEGEREIQKRAGVAEMASRLANGIHSELPPVAREFIQLQPMAIIASMEGNGAVWASVLTGEPGFLRAEEDQTVIVHAEPLPGDPLKQILASLAQNSRHARVGLLVIDLATRRRMRVNGEARLRSEGGFSVHVQQAYANCPKYIQSRSLFRETAVISGAPIAHNGKQLTAEQQQWIARSDTFFIASAHSAGGADASHRGGRPGFVHVLDATRLMFPDYSGNNMFNTLGNLAVNPHAGLLFVDFTTGDTLQLTGTTRVLWGEEDTNPFPGAQRVIDFQIESIVQTDNAVPLRWNLVQLSPFNPK